MLRRQTVHAQAGLEQCEIAAGPSVVPANSSRLNIVTDGNWAAIGHAAMAFDPLSGQGVYRALRSASHEAQSVVEYLDGDGSALKGYALDTTRAFDRYLLPRDAFYSSERRWPRGLFWQRRRAGRRPDV